MIRPLPLTNRKIKTWANQLADRILHAIDPDIARFGYNFDIAYEGFIYPEYGIIFEDGCDLGFDEKWVRILGAYDPYNYIARIDASLDISQRDPRRTFTCWHEVAGHGILQGDWLRSELARLKSSSHIVTTEATLSFETLNRLERQANLFAANLAVPDRLLYKAIRETFAFSRPFRYVGPGEYEFDVFGARVVRHIEDFNDLCQRIASFIHRSFGGMSWESIGYRIAECGFAIDATKKTFELYRVASVSSIIAEPVFS